MTKPLDLTGKQVGKLTVLFRLPRTNKGYFSWRCRCACGEVVDRTAIAIVHEGTFSCGCTRRNPNSGQFKRVHGASHSKEYFTWGTIKQRTTNPKAHAYERYGGAGIKMCDEWLGSFPAFLRDVGPAPSQEHTLDRVDNTKGYEPGNVRWATYSQQNINRKGTVYAEIKGDSKPVIEWCRLLGADYFLVMNRIRAGWAAERALVTPKLR